MVLIPQVVIIQIGDVAAPGICNTHILGHTLIASVLWQIHAIELDSALQKVRPHVAHHRLCGLRPVIHNENLEVRHGLLENAL